MIYINRNRLKFNEIKGLIDAADAAQAEINAESDPAERRKLIARHQDKWVAFRNAFAKLSYHKCWYTESINPGAEWDVDHFRPKNRLKEEKEHGGYYWLALKWENFRLSCHRSNRLGRNPESQEVQGKADRFPLLDRAKCAWSPTDSLNAERPALLDPCDITDPLKLTFSMDGKVAVAPDYEGVPEAVQQVRVSRRLLHLDWPAFVDQRVELYNLIFRLVSEGKNHLALVETGDVNSRANWMRVMSDLSDLTCPDKPYSAAATAYIQLFKSVWWVKAIVLKLPRESYGAQGVA